MQLCDLFFINESNHMSTMLRCSIRGTKRDLPKELVLLIIRVFSDYMEEYGYWDGASSCLNYGLTLSLGSTSALTSVLTTWNPRQTWHSGLACYWDCVHEHEDQMEE